MQIRSLGVYDDVGAEDPRPNRADAHANIEKSEAAETRLTQGKTFITNRG